ncbi:MAG: hypothetical protein HY777_11620 [Betaproteobacteria bacterium]|nr:hypothetical protein [Betaproteobacteria bacterium]
MTKPKAGTRKQAAPTTAPEPEAIQEKPQATPGTDGPSPKKPPRPAKAGAAPAVAGTVAGIAAAPTAVAAPAEASATKQGDPAKEKKSAAKKPKLVRDSFTFPEADYAVFGTLKQRVLKAGREVKKSELLRAGLAVLSEMPLEDLLQALDGVDKLKPGRPAG